MENDEQSQTSENRSLNGDSSKSIAKNARRRKLQPYPKGVQEMEFDYQPSEPIKIFRITQHQADSISSVALKREVCILCLGCLMGIAVTTAATIFSGSFPDATTRFEFTTTFVVSLFLILFIGFFYVLFLIDSCKLNKDIFRHKGVSK